MSLLIHALDTCLWHISPQVYPCRLDWYAGPRINIKTVFPRYGITMLKIRLSQDRLIFNMGIPILVRWHLHIDTAPRSPWVHIVIDIYHIVKQITKIKQMPISPASGNHQSYFKANEYNMILMLLITGLHVNHRISLVTDATGKRKLWFTSHGLSWDITCYWSHGKKEM